TQSPPDTLWTKTYGGTDNNSGAGTVIQITDSTEIPFDGSNAHHVTNPPSDITEINFVWKHVSNPSEIVFDWVSIPAGDFTYSSNDQIVNINYGYEIMKYEVTNKEYVAYLNDAYIHGKVIVTNLSVKGHYTGDNNWIAGEYEYYDLDGNVDNYNVKKITWSGTRFSIENGYENHPVIFVTWFGADAFAKYYGYRLPTEQEWEKTARGNTDFDYPWGDTITGINANYWDSGDPFDNGTTPVGYYNGNNHNGYQVLDSPSPYGAYDMAGNVWEWTDSFFSNSSTHRVARGGSFGSYVEYLNSYERHHYLSTFKDVNVGFRCIKPFFVGIETIDNGEIQFKSYPNPFSNSTTIEYQVTDYSMVSLKIYDLQGKVVKTLINNYETPGRKTIVWNGTDNSGNQLVSGIFLILIQIDGVITTKQLILTKS
ncbi:SUMF1/EgtB/PvdO family nonheme iron enzyme, partial [Bacteroidota bacterium]